MRNKSTFFINLIGLSTGLACVLLIHLWVNDERSIDKFHEADAHLYQVMQMFPMAGQNQLLAPSPAPLARAMEAEIPEIEQAISGMIPTNFDGIIAYQKEKGVKVAPAFMEDGFFDLFSYHLIHGEKSQVLKDRYSVVISETIALKLFGSTEAAIGKTVDWKKKVGDIVDFSQVFTVTGVFNEMQKQSSQNFDVVFTYDFYDSKNSSSQNWNNDHANTFVLLKEEADIEEINKKTTQLVAANRNRETQFFLKQYSAQYLHGTYENGESVGGRIEYVRLFSIVALLILLIACINFMNLSTAKASIRLKEIGIKKTLGSSRMKLGTQFMSESILMSLLALVLAISMIFLLLPQFNEITGKSLSIHWQPKLVFTFLSIAVVTGLLSSIYPAFYLSGFQPVEVLKGKLSTSLGELFVRKGLVIFQFTLSVLLIIGVLVIYQQMQFIRNEKLGYDRENILSFKNEAGLNKDVESFLAELRKLPEVLYATNTNNKFVGNENWTSGLHWEGKEEDQTFVIDAFIGNYDFIETFGIQLKEGRSFSETYGTENSKVILNESAAKAIGFEQTIGQKMRFWNRDVEVIGIVKDFQYKSFYHEAKPCIIGLLEEGDSFGEHIWVKIKSGQEQSAISSIATLYERFHPNVLFDYTFVDAQYQALYESENRIATLSKYFAGLGILISCLGLFALVTFTAERRQKEISIRKVLGASVSSIISLLSRDFLALVVIAFMIATPMAYYFMLQWLEGFAYHINIHWSIFVFAGLSVIGVALLTVSFQSIKAALTNPIESLKNE